MSLEPRDYPGEYAHAYAGDTILITGGAGAIGSNLTAALLQLGAREVIVVDDLSSAVRWSLPDDPKVTFIQGSILDEQTVRRAFRTQPKVVFHLAALFANQNSLDHPEDDLLVNGLGTLRILQYAHLARAQRLVYAASGCSVYGSKAPLPMTEDFMSMDLDTPYQITKMLGELYCNFYHNYYSLETVRTRFFNSYGPGEVPGRYRNVIPNFIYWAMKGQPLTITGTGEETRDFTYVGDIVDGLLRAGSMASAVGEAFNLASGRETRITDLATWVNEATGNKAGVVRAERRKWDTHSRRRASVEKARTLVGYEPKTDFSDGLMTTVRWFRQNWDKIENSARF
jgi:UDP-glucose 4-epimerase